MILALISLSFAEPLSIDDAMRYAMQNNLQLKRALQDLRSAEAQVLSARSIFDPNLSSTAGRNFSTQQQFFAGFGIINTEFFGPTWSVGSSFTLPTGGQISIDWTTNQSKSRYTIEGAPVDQQINPYDTRLSLNINHNLLDGFGLKNNTQPIESAKRGIDISNLSLRSTQQQILADVTSAYWSARYQYRLHEIALESVNIAEEEARVVAAQVAEGNLADVERSRVEAARLSALSAAADAEQAYASALDGLRVLIGLPLSAEIDLSSLPTQPTQISSSLESVLQDAKEQSLSLKQADLNVIEAEEQLRLAKNKRLPDLSANAQYALSGWEEELSDAITEMLDASLPSTYIGLNLNIPLLNLASKGEIGQRLAALETARIDRESQAQALLQQVAAQHRSLTASLLKIDLAHANLEVAEATLLADRALRDAGRAIEKDVLSSVRAVDEAKSQLEKALADYQLAQIELDRLTGSLSVPSP